MANALFASARLSDDATLTGSTVAGSMPLSYLQLQQPTDRCRWTTTSPYLVIDLSATALTSWTVLYLLFCAGPAGSDLSAAQVRVRTATSVANLTASPVIDQTVNLWPCSGLEDWDRVHFRYYNSAGISQLYIRLDLPTGLDYFEAGRLIVDDAFQLSAGSLFYGSGYGLSAPAAAVVSQGGQRYPREVAVHDLYNFRIQIDSRIADPEAEALGGYRKLLRLHGPHKDLVLDEDPASTANSMDKIVYGTLASIETPIVVQSFKMYENNGSIRGLI